MNRETNYRPDYDYYEDSLGDSYDDYDELYTQDVPEDAFFNAEDDKDETDEDEYDEYEIGDPDEQENSKDFTTLEDITAGPETETDGKTDTNGYKYTKEYLIELMDRYHNGDEADKKDVRNQFCIMLTPLIKHTIRVSRGIDSEYIDYIQHCYLYICKRLDRFDPNISFAFKYFKYVIQEAITSCHIDSYGKSSHEMNIDRKVRKQLREYAAMDINPSPSRIASETGLTVHQVEVSLFRIRAEKPVLGEDMTMFERGDNSNLPLDEILKNEVYEALGNAIRLLPDMEREAILLSYNYYDLDEEYSNKKIAEILHVSEIKVKELLISAKRHLKRDFSLDQLLGKSKRISQREYYCRENDPSLYSFDPESDEFELLDKDDDEAISAQKNDPENVIIVDRISDIIFEKY